jgi:ribosomal subunit interface protein
MKMHVELKLQQVNPEKLLLDYAQRRLHFVLGRFGERIGKVTTRISVSPDRGSTELICRVSAELRPFGVITAEATESDVYTSIDRCAGRLARRCASKCERQRDGRLSRKSIRVPMSHPAA